MAQHVLSMKGKDSYMSLNVRIFFNIMTQVGFTLLGRMYMRYRSCDMYIYCIYYVISWKNYSRKILSCDYHATVHVRYCFNQFHLITHAKGNPWHHWDWVLNNRHPQAWSQFNIRFLVDSVDNQVCLMYI
jgi:hypothetical protein